jgi:hypothetical protein
VAAQITMDMQQIAKVAGFPVSLETALAARAKSESRLSHYMLG